MSFRRRLHVFFALIVLVPLAAVALVAFLLIGSSERGKADAGTATAQRTAFGLYREDAARARPVLRRVAADRQLTTAILSGDRRQATARMRALVAAGGGPAAIALWSSTGRPLAAAGSAAAIAPHVARLDTRDQAKGSARGQLDARGDTANAVLAVSVTTAARFVRQVARLTGLDVALYRHGRPLAATIDPAPAALPGSSSHRISAGGTDYRVRSATVQDGAGPPVELLLLRPARSIDDQIANSRLLILAIVGVFLLAAVAAAGIVSRALNGQIAKLLEAARRLGRGDFSRPVPVRGGDEFAQLGTEFNGMSAQLESKIDEVERKRAELEETIRRVGDALATGLERQGVIDLAVRQAVEGCNADTGRALPIDTDAFERTEVGSAEGALAEALEAAERQAFEPRPDTARELLGPLDADDRSPPQRRAATTSSNGGYAAAVAMRSVVGAVGTSAEYVGVLSLARRVGPFTREQLELLEYLAGQSVVSIENASLYAAVQRQAFTDELTGLANIRAMHAVLERELDRARRLGSPVGFLMVDMDHFKRINDERGHQCGDDVLIAVAGVLRELSRDIDTTARYGGEEMAVVLPGTDVEGVAQLAERMRVAIEQLSIPVSGGEPLHVTASFGAASFPESAAGKPGLIAAADSALYRAKGAGRNRVERAEPVVAPVSGRADSAGRPR
jgi:diguanylate cyclase (GGDEF)-like protein